MATPKKSLVYYKRKVEKLSALVDSLLIQNKQLEKANKHVCALANLYLDDLMLYKKGTLVLHQRYNQLEFTLLLAQKSTFRKLVDYINGGIKWVRLRFQG